MITVQVRMVVIWWGAHGGASGGCRVLRTGLGSPRDQAGSHMLPLSSFLYLASGADILEHTPHVTPQRVRRTATVSAATGVLVLVLTAGKRG